ncbi:NUDIX hydrolase [Anaeromyxobacter dehalogenans 2CP-1]|uniref:NUDIX hydrolase n=1 Tax=Anaeromyxobacter dehalogenans (strain ATCC BAA-258 / DSM 21875 / 2CP-1) TaxID=455488 RepID=B8J8T7_ANAD2|nr:CoA pyrophosphatase [Anaeromyxobacter dehalogenans]ACL63535.1 NUDIX hydrolase [Anaeromyxobacter dehalogenans 2CP-1]
MTLDDLAAALVAREPGIAPVDRIAQEHLPRGGFASAAVLVPLHVLDGEVHVLMIRRPMKMSRHAGQIAFPGGKIDPGEESLAAALREAHEEVGLEPARADVMGQLSETLVLASAFRLTPWVASVPYPYPYAAAPHEVDEILHVPLSALSRPGAHRVEWREVYGLRLDVHFFSVGKDVIWGATGRVLAELLSIWRAS